MRKAWQRNEKLYHKLISAKNFISSNKYQELWKKKKKQDRNRFYKLITASGEKLCVALTQVRFVTINRSIIFLTHLLS